jgi:hypothetical protein
VALNWPLVGRGRLCRRALDINRPADTGLRRRLFATTCLKNDAVQLAGLRSQTGIMSAIDMTPFNGGVQINIALGLYGRGGYGLRRVCAGVTTSALESFCAPVRRSRLRFATNLGVEGPTTAQTGRIVKHFQEIRCSGKSLSGNGLRYILHVVSRKIAEIDRVNRGVWLFYVPQARGGVNIPEVVLGDT